MHADPVTMTMTITITVPMSRAHEAMDLATRLQQLEVLAKPIAAEPDALIVGQRYEVNYRKRGNHRDQTGHFTGTIARIIPDSSTKPPRPDLARYHFIDVESGRRTPHPNKLTPDQIVSARPV